MTKAEMEHKLNTQAGIGTACTLNGKTRYNFYEDTFDKSGIAIAMETIYPLLFAGDIDSVTFIEKTTLHKEA